MNRELVHRISMNRESVHRLTMNRTWKLGTVPRLTMNRCKFSFNYERIKKSITVPSTFYDILSK